MKQRCRGKGSQGASGGFFSVLTGGFTAKGEQWQPNLQNNFGGNVISASLRLWDFDSSAWFQ